MEFSALRFSERVIAVTMIAIGTSVPELAASVIAALKKEKAIIEDKIKTSADDVANIKKKVKSTKSAKKTTSKFKKKYMYDAESINNKNIILVDDSLVRGITVKNIINSLRECGAKEVHIRVSSPQVKDICYYGVDIPTQNELIANNYDIYGIQRVINADSLIYLDLDLIKDCFGSNASNLCTGCFNSDYKTKLEW